MKKSMLDILACPIDKYYPLELFEIKVKHDIDTANESEAVVEDGLLFCPKCSRFYPIIDEIPIMLPDELRNKQQDIEFLHKWHQKLPAEILHNAKPWHI
jgi:uncharacterized protein